MPNKPFNPTSRENARRGLTAALASMRDNQFGFEYSWADLQPIRLLMIVVIFFQVAGSVLGLWVAHFSEWFSNLWAGGAIATFPGFLVGSLRRD